MGLHETCRNPYHHFDKTKPLVAERVGDDVVYQGFCKECGCLRIVYERELKNYKIISAKMNKI